jgi:hypothetical protein
VTFLLTAHEPSSQAVDAVAVPLERINVTEAVFGFWLLAWNGRLLEFRRGLGVRVSGTPQRGAVIARARELVSFARQQGYPPEELISIIHNIR